MLFVWNFLMGWLKYCCSLGQARHVPKVMSTLFCFQQVVLKAFFHWDLCRLHGLVHQLFVCFAKNKGVTVTKQRMSHWVIKAISAAYEAHGMAFPLVYMLIPPEWLLPRLSLRVWRIYVLLQNGPLWTPQVHEGIMIYRSHSNGYAAQVNLWKGTVVLGCCFLHNKNSDKVACSMFL